MATEPKRPISEGFTPVERFLLSVAPVLAAALTAIHHGQRNVEERVAEANGRIAVAQIQIAAAQIKIAQLVESTKAMRDVKSGHNTELDSSPLRDPFRNVSGVQITKPGTETELSVPPFERRPYGPVDVPDEFRPVRPHFDWREQPGVLDRGR
jgi:hypothetical protein